ncbi:MAG: cysteine desulfurase family protein [Actinomycetota bacterium]|nr:cysteine desulfurase family protein [Actinomycetota bacterium]
MTTEPASRVIYLDHNATTPVAPEVADAMDPYLRGDFGNPSSDHVLGQRARKAVEEAREQVAALIGAAPKEVVFTSGGTESNNLAIRGVAAQAPAERCRIVTSTVEHPATTAPLALLEASGWTLTRVPVAASGILDLAAALAALGDDVALVTVMLAQNETGALMPVAELAAAARAHGTVVHTDAAQAIGKIPVSVDDLGVDLCSIAAHKCYGPKGVGALYVRRGTPLSPLLVGAGQERGLRPGTENVAGIVGLGAAAQLAAGRLEADAVQIGQLRDELWAALSAKVPGIRRHTPEGACVSNTLLVSFPGVGGTDVLAQAPQIAASTGSACHAGEHTANATLTAMGVAPEIALGAVRLSLGRDSTAADLESAAELLADAHQALVPTNPSPTSVTKGTPR